MGEGRETRARVRARQDLALHRQWPRSAETAASQPPRSGGCQPPLEMARTARDHRVAHGGPRRLHWRTWINLDPAGESVCELRCGAWGGCRRRRLESVGRRAGGVQSSR